MRDPRIRNPSPASPFNVRGSRDGYGYWAPADGDVDCRGVAAKVSHAGLTLTSTIDDTSGNELEISFLFNADGDDTIIAQSGRTFVISTPAASVTGADFEELFNANLQVFEGLFTMSGEGTAAAMPPRLTFTGGRTFLEIEKFVVNGVGTVSLVGIGDEDSQAVNYAFRDGQEVLMRFDKIIAADTTVTGLTFFGH